MKSSYLGFCVKTITEAVRLGASGYVVKPFKSEEILATVRKKLKETK